MSADASTALSDRGSGAAGRAAARAAILAGARGGLRRRGIGRQPPRGQRLAHRERVDRRLARARLSIAVVGVRFFAVSRAVTRYLERLSGPRRGAPSARRHPGQPGAPPRAAVARRPRLVLDRGQVLAALVDDVENLQNLPLRVVQLAAVASVVAVGAVGFIAFVSPPAALTLFAVCLIVAAAARRSMRLGWVFGSRAEALRSVRPSRRPYRPRSSTISAASMCSSRTAPRRRARARIADADADAPSRGRPGPRSRRRLTPRALRCWPSPVLPRCGRSPAAAPGLAAGRSRARGWPSSSSSDGRVRGLRGGAAGGSVLAQVRSGRNASRIRCRRSCRKGRARGRGAARAGRRPSARAACCGRVRAVARIGGCRAAGVDSIRPGERVLVVGSSGAGKVDARARAGPLPRDGRAYHIGGRRCTISRPTTCG